MNMISYAQNREDVLLARAFRGKQSGFYVDAGAGHPTESSVTRHFYDLGWKGINVEPGEEFFDLLEHERPRDVNLRVALGDAAGEAVLFEVLHPEGSNVRASGLSSLSSQFLDDFRQAGLEIREVQVLTRTLREILEEHAPPEIDFLKIDVEGWERQVLEGADLSSSRPRVLVIEAVEPTVLGSSAESTEGKVSDARGDGRGRSCWEDWEPIVLEAGYTFAQFDGLNRFYVRQGEPELLERLRAPVSPLDEFQPHALVLTRGALDEIQAEAARLLREVKAERGARLRLQRQRDAIQEQLRILLASRSWRLTQPMRQAIELMRELRKG